MKSCSADYKTAKAGAGLAGQSYMQLVSACMKGKTSVGQVITAKPASGSAVT